MCRPSAFASVTCLLRWWCRIHWASCLRSRRTAAVYERTLWPNCGVLNIDVTTAPAAQPVAGACAQAAVSQQRMRVWGWEAGRRHGHGESCEWCLACGGIWASGESGGGRPIGTRRQGRSRLLCAFMLRKCACAIDLNGRTDGRTGRVGGLVAIFRLSAFQEITLRRRQALMYTHQSLDALSSILSSNSHARISPTGHGPTNPATPDPLSWTSLASVRPPASPLPRRFASAPAALEAQSRRRAQRR